MRMANQSGGAVRRFPNDGGSCWVVIRSFDGISAGYDIACFDLIKQITNYRWSTARQYKHIIIRQTAPLNSAHDKRLGLCIAATMRTDALLYGFLQKRCTARIRLRFDRGVCRAMSRVRLHARSYGCLGASSATPSWQTVGGACRRTLGPSLGGAVKINRSGLPTLTSIIERSSICPDLLIRW